MKVAKLCPVPYMLGMAKLTRSNSVAAMVDAAPTFGAGTGRFSIGLTSGETGLTYHLHLTEDESPPVTDPAPLEVRIDMGQHQAIGIGDP
jgi:hypothetical protein